MEKHLIFEWSTREHITIHVKCKITPRVYTQHSAEQQNTKQHHNIVCEQIRQRLKLMLEIQIYISQHWIEHKLYIKGTNITIPYTVKIPFAFFSKKGSEIKGL